MDELTVVQDFVSDDYFSSDSTKESFKAKSLELRKEWEQDVTDAEAEGRTLTTPLTAWSGARQQLQKQLISLNERFGEDKRVNNDNIDAVQTFYQALLSFLGYSSGYDVMPGRNHDGTEAPYLEVRGTATTEDSSSLLIVFASPANDVAGLLDKDDATLLVPVVQTASDSSEKLERTVSTARYLSKRFVEENPPNFALVLAGPTMLLTSSGRWQEGRYLAIDLGLLFERNDTKRGGAVDQFLACTSARALAPSADGTTWFVSVLEDSVKHTEKVSEDLREAVQKSIEIIANEVVIRRRRDGLHPLPAEEAQALAKQALRFLYRILFLLFAEASPELNVVPVGATEYETGYGLDRLRDLALADIPNRQDGTHLYQSLNVLFTQIQFGHNDLRTAERTPEDDADISEGLVFHPLEADLFSTTATAHIDEVGLGNAALQRVLQKLLLSKETAKKARGFISYAELGINQLGRVYEGLMSYTGFFAETDLFEVAPNGDSSKGSWVVPTNRADQIEEKDFVREFDNSNGEDKAVVHPKGSFVFRLSGRDRQQSASYYTPEVLTRFTVSQALAELLTDEMPAEKILQVTVCEPALGSGAFALEAVNQLAAEYLQRRQIELGKRIDPAMYQQELQKTKAYIALHNVYGVDLNSTAVELAEISLWLDTMVAGLSAPWFGLRLRRGNSLIGARRSVYSRTTVKDKSWLKTTPEKAAAAGRDPQSIYQFLLPAEGWGAAADGKEGKALAPEAVTRLKNWRKTMRVKLGDAKNNSQIGRLVGLSRQVDVLWEIALKRLTIAEAEARRTINVWGLDEAESGSTITRAEIEMKLADQGGAYQRLRRVMDAWCALWFWPLTETEILPPSIDEWIDACEMLLGKSGDVKKIQGHSGQASMFDVDNWSELNEYEGNQRAISGAAGNIATVLEKHPWLNVTEAIAKQQGFFHWDLDFATVFEKGGFDLQLGNPPWVRPDWNEADILGDFDVAFALESKMPVERWNRLKDEALAAGSNLSTYIEQASFNAGNRAYLSDETTYPIISGLRTDLYRCFMEQTWSHQKPGGVVALVHPESHFTDNRAQALRRNTYIRLRRHWQFVNELRLFEIDHRVTYGVHVYGDKHEYPAFLMASSLYHPVTVERSLVHNGEGMEPGLKDTQGEWDLRPHASRILKVVPESLAIWRDVLHADSSDPLETSALYALNQSAINSLEKMSRTKRLSSKNPQGSLGWDENADFRRGVFVKSWGKASSWADAILQGPHINVNLPFYKQPNKTLGGNSDWSNVDLEKLSDRALPVTIYKPSQGGVKDGRYPSWELCSGAVVSSAEFYRLAWRSMARSTNARTLIPSIIPPGPTYLTQSVYAVGFPDGKLSDLLVSAGVASSLLADFLIRSSPKSAIPVKAVKRLPCDFGFPLLSSLTLRVLRLNAVTVEFSGMWSQVTSDLEEDDSWTSENSLGRLSAKLGEFEDTWSQISPLRLAADRRQAQIEIDALVAVMLGVTADELCSIYRTQFPVLFKYDTQRDHYDQNGRLVPVEVLKAWQKLGDTASEEDLSATNAQGFEYTYAPPFRTLDREADMRTAYAEFEQRLADREGQPITSASNPGAES